VKEEKIRVNAKETLEKTYKETFINYKIREANTICFLKK